MSVSVVEIARAVQLNAVSLTAESSGYLLLAIVDAGGLAGPVPADQMILLENGEFRLGAIARRDSAAAASDLRQLLGRLMALCSATHPPLAAVSCAEGSDFAQSLLAALIPVNRAAAKRTLARTCRETGRAVRAGKLNDLGPAWQWLQGAPARQPQPTTTVERAAAPALPPSTPVTSKAEPPVQASVPVQASIPVQVSADWSTVEHEIDAAEIQPEHTVRIDQLRIAAKTGVLAEDRAAAAVEEYRRVTEPVRAVPEEPHSKTPFLGSVQTALRQTPLPQSQPVQHVEEKAVEALPIEAENMARSDGTAEEDGFFEAIGLNEASEPDVASSAGAQHALDCARAGSVPAPTAEAPSEPVEIAESIEPQYLAAPAPEPEPVIAEPEPEKTPSWQAAPAPISSWPIAAERIDCVVAKAPSVGKFALVIEDEASRAPQFFEEGAFLIDNEVIAKVSERPRIQVPAAQSVFYSPRKSDIGELLQRFNEQGVDGDEISRELKHIAGIEPSGSSQTPPPVGFSELDESQPAQAAPDRDLRTGYHGISFGVGLAGLAALSVIWVAVRAPMTASAPALAASAPTQCVASIKVIDAPAHAEIKIRSVAPKVKDGFTPLLAHGSEALFPRLPCGAPLEVVVRDLDQREASWSVIPVAASELQAQTALFPLEISARNQ